MGNSSALKSHPSASQVCAEAAPRSIGADGAADGLVDAGDADGKLLAGDIVGPAVVSRRSSVVASASMVRSTHSMNMWQNPVPESTSAMHSSWDRQAAMHSVSECPPPESLKTGARDSRLFLLHRSSVSSRSKNSCPVTCPA